MRKRYSATSGTTWRQYPDKSNRFLTHHFSWIRLGAQSIPAPAEYFENVKTPLLVLKPPRLREGNTSHHMVEKPPSQVPPPIADPSVHQVYRGSGSDALLGNFLGLLGEYVCAQYKCFISHSVPMACSNITTVLSEWQFYSTLTEACNINSCIIHRALLIKKKESSNKNYEQVIISLWQMYIYSLYS